MIRSRWYSNPLFIFIFSLLALGTSLFLYIHSYLRVTSAFHRFVQERNLNASQLLDTETWVMILIMSILVAMIIGGLLIIFAYYQKMIQLYRMQSNFINGFTHELKTPIASLRLFLDTFSRHQLTREQQEKYLGYMHRDTDRLDGNVNQILNLARIEDKKYKTEWTVKDLKKFTLEWLHRSPYWLEDADITLEGDGYFVVKFDEQLMAMVLANLVNNSTIYNNSSRPKINISFSMKGRNIVLTVEDNGIGILKKEQKNIFKKFYQIQSKGKGSGIGLYTVQQIVKLHKGQIKVFSRGPGEGTTFFVNLPLDLSHMDCINNQKERFRYRFSQRS